MSARTKARKRAIDALFSADLRGTSADEMISTAFEHSEDPAAQAASFDYAKQIVAGVTQHQAEIDETLETYAHGWSIGRMPNLDRAILRAAVWEILFNDDVPDAVAVDEAVELAKEFSTEDSSGFINGLLNKISATRA
ncbi:MAG: transcription antitermination factor NusB [Micrococcales bacterium]